MLCLGIAQSKGWRAESLVTDHCPTREDGLCRPVVAILSPPQQTFEELVFAGQCHLIYRVGDWLKVITRSSEHREAVWIAKPFAPASHGNTGSWLELQRGCDRRIG